MATKLKTEAPNPSTEEMTTLSEVIEDLRNRGYVVDFNLLATHLECKSPPCKLSPSEFEIDQSYRFEGESNPSDEAVVYAISAKNRNLKGILVNAYGVYTDPVIGDMAKKLKA